VTAPYIFLIPVTAWLCKTRKVADVRDLVWHYLPEGNFIKRFVKNWLQKIMHRSLQKFDAITLTNEAEKRWMMEHGFPESELNVIPNGLSAEKFRQLTEVKYAPHPQKITITYIGNIGSSQHFNCLIDSVREMKDVRLNIVGEGNEFGKLSAYIHSKKIQNVTLTGKLKWRRIVPYYQTANILYASLRDNFDTAIPSKLYEYLATGLPVIYHGDGAGADLIRNYENTFVVNSLNVADLQKVIWKIQELKPGKSYRNIQEIGQNFIREKLSNRFVELCAFLLNEKSLSEIFVEDVLETIQ
jgi:glycosyltransferase involved in cell wall biosynthesis